MLLKGLITSAYYSAAALSIKFGGGEALRARSPLAILLAVHALTLMTAVPASLTGSFLPNQSPQVLSWFGVIHFETLIFAIGTAIFLIVMMKERNESRLIATSHTDALTGVANRRGFFIKAERILERCRGDETSVAVVAFDLDRFKAINDKYGHASGDRVLKLFVEICAGTMRPGDLFARLGGEEFVVVLPGSGIEAGRAAADRVRKALADVSANIDGKSVKCTVSGGVSAGTGIEDIHTLLRQADVSLYRAKSLGRNRVECFDSRSQDELPANVMRVA